jgi:hypothetical protein
MEVQISIEELTAILIEEYGYTIEELVFRSKISWAICDLFLFQKQNTTTFKGYRRATKAFILAKEIAYNYLQITERLYTFSWIKFDNFDQVLNNFTLLILQEPCLFLGKINR